MTTFSPIINYSNEVITYPMYTEYSDILITSRTFNNYITVSASKADFKNIKTGQYLFLDTGTQTSQILKIIGINRAGFKIITDRAVSVQALDSVVRVIDFETLQNFMVYNNGLANVYVNTQTLSPNSKAYFTDKVIIEPVVIYGSSDFTVAIGNIEKLPSTSTLPSGTMLFAEGVGDGTDTIVIPELAGIPEANLKIMVTGNSNYTIGVEIFSYDSVTGTFVMDGFNIDIGQKFYVTYILP